MGVWTGVAGHMREELDQQGPLLNQPISWARVVWIDPRHAPEGADRLVNLWLWRPCEGTVVPWMHNYLYIVELPGGNVRVKVGDIRECGWEREPPTEPIPQLDPH